jgi:hypothetical protein
VREREKGGVSMHSPPPPFSLSLSTTHTHTHTHLQAISFAEGLRDELPKYEDRSHRESDCSDRVHLHTAQCLVGRGRHVRGEMAATGFVFTPHGVLVWRGGASMGKEGGACTWAVNDLCMDHFACMAMHQSIQQNGEGFHCARIAEDQC